MDIALLNVKIVIQKNSVVVDKIGNHKNEWTDYYSCYAIASGESPSENTDAGTVVDNSKIDFTIGDCKSGSAVDSTGYRVIYNGEIYNILGIDHKNFKKRSVKLKCQKARR